MIRPDIEVVHVGSASRDISRTDPRGWRLGGGVTFSALTTARLGLRTAAFIGADPTTATASELEILRDAGVRIRIIPVDEGPAFENRETPQGRVQVCHSVGRPLAIPPIDPEWAAASGWSLAPVAGEIPDGWAAVVPPRAFTAVGWQGLLRDLRAGRPVGRRPPGPSALLRRADLVGVSRHDVPSGSDDARLAAFLKPGSDLLVTEGDAGGRLVRVGEEGPRRIERYRPIAAAQVDPTGAGDTFLAALLVSILEAGAADGDLTTGGPDLRFAAAAASLVVEGIGLEAVPDRPAVRRRMARFD
jgi:sugar/nucleoside kinase (ribokinase family)